MAIKNVGETVKVFQTNNNNRVIPSPENIHANAVSQLSQDDVVFSFFFFENQLQESSALDLAIDYGFPSL